MKVFSENITPDSFSGALFAVEGIADSCTVLNGPTGCKFYHSSISDSQFIREPLRDFPGTGGEFWFGMPRIPATALDGNDYVFSSREKLARLLRAVAERKNGLVAVINSPGAALIGDDLGSFLKDTLGKTPWFALETAGFSGSFGEGSQKALSRAVDVLGKRGGTVRPKSVNLLGIGIYQKYFEGNRAALERLLARCGVEVLAAPGAGDPAARFARLSEAALNVAVYPEYGLALAEKLRGEYGTPFIVPAEGPPAGFDASESFVREICAVLDADPAPALEDIDRGRARAYRYLARFSTVMGSIRGARFSVRAEASTAYAITKCCASYLGMIPAAVSVTGEAERSFEPKLRDWLESIHHAEALNRPPAATPAQIVLGDGNTIAAARLEGHEFCGIEISIPTLNYLDIVEKSLFGPEGALFLLEQIVNGLRYVT